MPVLMLGEAMNGRMRSIRFVWTHPRDRFIQRIWDAVQTPRVTNQAGLIITTDHGRGATTKD